MPPAYPNSPTISSSSQTQSVNPASIAGVTLHGWWSRSIGFAALAFASLPAYRLALRIRRRQRVLEGHCKQCGYDLRATPERCPGCGTIPAR
jgi:hypothetical protein